MEPSEASDYIFKIICVGDAGVGKTSLTMRYATDKFSEDYRMTLGMNLVTKNIDLQKDGQHIAVQLSIWDTGGQIAFAPLLPMYFKGALGALIVYDITKEKSFEQLEKWVNDVREHCNEIPITIIGNKKDLEVTRQVTEQDGQTKSNEIKQNWSSIVTFFETSAKDDIKVNDAFTTLANVILQIVSEEEDVDEPVFGTLV